MSSTDSKLTGRPKRQTRGESSVTRHDLAEKISASIDINHRISAAIVDDIVSSITDELAAGNDVLISGFGKFVTQHKASRIGLNPKTKEPLTISARRILKFRPSALLRQGLMNSLIKK